MVLCDAKNGADVPYESLITARPALNRDVVHLPGMCMNQFMDDVKETADAQ